MKWMAVLYLLLAGLTATAQPDSVAPAYKRFPVVPPFRLLLTDSITLYTKEDLPRKTPVLMMVFNPDCEHCQHEADAFYTHRDELKKVQIVMATTYPLAKVRSFITNHRLTEMPNVVVALDPGYFLITFFAVHNLPYLAAYNKKGTLISTFEGLQPIEKIIAVFQNK